MRIPRIIWLGILLLIGGAALTGLVHWLNQPIHPVLFRSYSDNFAGMWA